MVAQFPHRLTDEQKQSGQTTQARNARATRTRKWLKYEELVDADLNDPSCSKKERVELIRAQDTVAERLRILSGAVKPGSRNVSVRELSDSERTKRLPASRSRPADYLADAKATLDAAHRATEARSMPDAPTGQP